MIKVIRNQARQQQIFKLLKPYNTESMCDDILEEFPNDSLDKFNEVNMTLKSDKSILKKVGKYFRTLLYNSKFDYIYWQFYLQIKLTTISWPKCIVCH